VVPWEFRTIKKTVANFVAPAGRRRYQTRFRARRFFTMPPEEIKNAVRRSAKITLRRTAISSFLNET
jgi:hypothetical protein